MKTNENKGVKEGDRKINRGPKRNRKMNSAIFRRNELIKFAIRTFKRKLTLRSWWTLKKKIEDTIRSIVQMSFS
jgi:hypothetical protein